MNGHRPEPRKRLTWRDVGHHPGAQFAFFNRVVPYLSIAPVAQHCFEKAYLQERSEVEDPETARRDPALGIAETARSLSEAKGIREARQKDALKKLPCGYR